jgi:hypothetical protein
MAITVTVCSANGPPAWIETALPEDASYAAVQRVVGDRLGGPIAHLRFGQLSILVNEAAELMGEPLNIMATAILRAYLGGAWAARLYRNPRGGGHPRSAADVLTRRRRCREALGAAVAAAWTDRLTKA